jgi:hypothetical protein
MFLSENVHALEGLACRARVAPASSPASHCKQGAAYAPRLRLRQAFSRMLWSQNNKNRPYIATLCRTLVSVCMCDCHGVLHRQYAKFPLRLARMPRSARARRSRTLLSTLAVALVLFANAFVGCDVDYTSLLVC